MPLNLFYTMVQKVKMTKNSNQGGPALIRKNYRNCGVLIL